MSPARAGAVVYALDLERMSLFYEGLFAMRRIHNSSDHTVLESPDIQLVVHTIPEPIAATITLSDPPELREQTAIKLFFTVPDLESARATAKSLGGDIFLQEWSGPGFIACNGCDPEGNILQVRESVS